MKQVNTVVNTGSIVIDMATGMTGTIGTIKQGEIKISFTVNGTLCISLFYSVRKLNNLVSSGKIKVIS